MCRTPPEPTMADDLPPSGRDRKLRAHKKSRQGCGNCKLRKIKCDESKPKCQRCAAFGVSCNYDYKFPDLQLAVNRGYNVQVLRNIPKSLNLIIPTVPPSPPWTPQFKVSPDGNAIYQLREQDLELLSKFQERTVLSITTERTVHIYGTESIKLACTYPFLMHALLLVTLMHDRFLDRALNPRLSATEAFHWYRSASMMNAKLSDPTLQPPERDALWITSVLLGIVAFFYIDAKTPEEAWPLKPPSSLDFNWLKMSDGKKAVWQMAQPLRADCVFQPLALEWASFAPRPPPRAGPEALPPEFIELYALNPMSTPENNPYHTAVYSLANSFDLENPTAITLNFLSFTYSICPEFKLLMVQKDPRALLILAYWYAKSCQAQCWWIWGRAWFECRAICIYLERHHPGKALIQSLLEYPRKMCSSYGR